MRSETIFGPLKMMKKAVYFTLRAVFILKIFKFLFRLFGHVKTKISKFMTSYSGKQTTAMHMFPNIYLKK